MTGRILTVGGLVALAHAKAIITNNCPGPVYIWSVPNVGSAHTENLPITSGSRYEEPWRYGTSEHPGIALKISPQPDGIYKGADEINFAYSVERSGKSNIWVDLSPVRGKPFDNNLAFHTCHGVYHSADVQTSQCDATDDVELVLCGTERSAPAKDSTSTQMITDCFDYHHDNSKYDHFEDENPGHTMPTTLVSVSATAPAYSSAQSSPKCSSSKATSTDRYQQPPKYTSSDAYQPPKYISSESYHQPPKYTSSDTYHQPPKNTSSAPYHQPPKHASSNAYHQPLKHTSHEPYAPPQKHTTTSTYHEPPKYTSVSHQSSKYTTEKSYSSPPKHTSEKSYPPPPPSPSHHTTDVYPAPPETKLYTSPPRYTSISDYPAPSRPWYPFPSDRPSPPAEHTEDDDSEDDGYEVPYPTPYGGDRVFRRNTKACDKTGNKTSSCNAPAQEAHDYCKPKVVHPKLNNTGATSIKLISIGIKTVIRQEVARHQIATASAAQSSAGVKPRAEKQKQCILPWCEPAVPGIDCKKLELTMELADRNQVDWTDDESICHTFLSSLHSTHATLAAKPSLCILPWCEPAQPGVNCAQQAASFESRDKGLVNWTDDEGACRTWLMPRNGTYSSRSMAKQKKCILPWCEPAQPGVDCEQQVKDFEQRDKGLVHWTDGEDACHAFHLAGFSSRHGDASVTVDSPSVIRRNALGRPQVCIAPFCWNLSNKECEKLEDAMEKYAKDQLGMKVDYTTDDDACGKFLAPRNSTSLVRRNSSLSVRRANTLKQTVKVCVLPFCKNKTFEECKTIEQDLEKAAKDNGDDVDYTTEDSVCKATGSNKVQRVIDAMIARAYTPSGKVTSKRSCISDICKDNHLSAEACMAQARYARGLVKEPSAHVEIRPNGDICVRE